MLLLLGEVYEYLLIGERITESMHGLYRDVA